MPRPVKCQQCEAFDDKSLMIKNEKGKYFHKEKCFEDHLREIEFKKKEKQQKDSLAIKIADVHELEDFKFIPSSFYPYIEDLRNDSELFGRLKKNYKNGLSYSAIEYTYEFCREKIKWSKQNKEFKNTLSELRYGLAIVKNNVLDAKNHFQRSRKMEQERLKLESETKVILEYTHENWNAAPVKKRDDLDISGLL